MPRINIEERFLKDGRLDKLKIKLGSRTMALGAILEVWITAQEYWRNGNYMGIPRPVWELEEFKNEIIEVGLAEDRGDFIYVKGAAEHFEWLVKNKENGGVGGKTRHLNSLKKNPSESKRIQPSYSYSYSYSKNINNKNISSELKQVSVLADFETISEIILERRVNESVQKSWLDAYIDAQWIISEIRKAIVWENSNPRRRKKDFPRFVANWLNRAWDSRKVTGAPAQLEKFTPFNKDEK